jgi:hypothetical protein
LRSLLSGAHSRDPLVQPILQEVHYRADGDVQIPFSGGDLGTAPRGLQTRGDRMILKPLMAAVAMTAAVSAMSVVVPSSAHAQSNAEAEIIGFHDLCNKGDRRACVRFGILIGQNQQRHADWRRAHADWWWWEKQ